LKYQAEIIKYSFNKKRPLEKKLYKNLKWMLMKNKWVNVNVLYYKNEFVELNETNLKLSWAIKSKIGVQ
jgi:hypothetical protein